MVVSVPVWNTVGETQSQKREMAKLHISPSYLVNIFDWVLQRVGRCGLGGCVACAGGRRAERAYSRQSVDPVACSALDGSALVRWRVGASARRSVGASTQQRPGRRSTLSTACAPLQEWQGCLWARKYNHCTTNQMAVLRQQ